LEAVNRKRASSGYYFKFNVDSILRASFKERMDGYGVAITNGIMKPSECREKEDCHMTKMQIN
jgi:phage portal protein BeeE